MGISVESESSSIAAFFDLDKTIISRSSTLAFGPPLYRHGLISKSAALRAAFGQLAFRLAGAGPRRMEHARAQVSELCRGWPADLVSAIVSRHLAEEIRPTCTRRPRPCSPPTRRWEDTIIVSTSGPGGRPISRLARDAIIATRMAVADGCYTGEMDFYAYGEAKASSVRELAAARGYRLPGCFAYSDSITDLPLLEAVGQPRAVNPDRALRRIARQRGWPVLSFAAHCPQLGKVANLTASTSHHQPAQRM